MVCNLQLSVLQIVAYTGWGCLFSLQPPFYPLVAEQKGAVPSQYGFVFGMSSLAAFIFSPIFGTYGNKLGPRTVFYLGAFAQGTCGIAFGFLQYVNSTWAFITLSYLIRFLQGISNTATMGASLAILIEMYPDRVTSLMSYTEMCVGLGYILGPAIGSILYEMGGFILPFEVMGSICILAAFGLFCSMPKYSTLSKNSTKERRKIALSDIVNNLSILLPLVDNALNYAADGAIEAMLEPFMRKTLGTEQREVSLVFLISGLVYLPCAPISGWVSMD